jgi:glycerophosphoryl diester phosphodiesterase
MNRIASPVVLACGLSAITVSGVAQPRGDSDGWGNHGYGNGRYGRDEPGWFFGDGHRRKGSNIQLGPRPYFLVNDMADGWLKWRLQRCFDDEPRRTDFSIGHRGAPLQFPEHTKESYEAAYRMGAGILECDVTFTSDEQLVCRHSQNDLATTTNILQTELASTCVTPFTPATLNPDSSINTPAIAECRTSEITLAEFKSLRGKMDAFDAGAQTVDEFVAGTPSFRTDLYAGPTSGTLLSHAESIALFQELGVKMTPELKVPSVQMPFNGYTQEDYAQQMIDEYKAAGVGPRDVYAQSFSIDDMLYWIRNEPEFGWRAVYLDDAETIDDLPDFNELVGYKTQGINIVAPPVFALLSLDANNGIVPSEYSYSAKSAGLDIITWTLERSGVLADGSNGFYYQTMDAAITREGDLMTVIDVLAREVGILGVFSDWAAPVSYYASCMGLR